MLDMLFINKSDLETMLAIYFSHFQYYIILTINNNECSEN